MAVASVNIVVYSQIRRLKWILLIYSRRLVTFSGMFTCHLVVFHSNYVIARHGKTAFSNQLNETVMKRLALRPLTRNVVVDESLYFDWIKSATCLLRSLAGKRLALNEWNAFDEWTDQFANWFGYEWHSFDELSDNLNLASARQRPFPSFPLVVTLQTSIDGVASLPLDPHGFRPLWGGSIRSVKCGIVSTGEKRGPAGRGKKCQRPFDLATCSVCFADLYPTHRSLRSTPPLNPSAAFIGVQNQKVVGGHCRAAFDVLWQMKTLQRALEWIPGSGQVHAGYERMNEIFLLSAVERQLLCRLRQSAHSPVSRFRVWMEFCLIWLSPDELKDWPRSLLLGITFHLRISLKFKVWMGRDVDFVWNELDWFDLNPSDESESWRRMWAPEAGKLVHLLPVT